MMQLDHRRQMIDTFVNAVYLYDDKVVLIFNYKEGSREVSFDDVKSSDLLLGVATKRIRRFFR